MCHASALDRVLPEFAPPPERAAAGRIRAIGTASRSLPPAVNASGLMNERKTFAPMNQASNIDLRYAGLGRADERRVKLAATALAAHQLAVRTDSWDGGHCDLLVLDSRDEIGAKALERARTDRIPALDLHRPERSAMQAVASVVWLTRSLHQMLREREGGTRMATAVANDKSPMGLVEFVTRGDLVGKPVMASHGSITIWLIPQSGHVLSHAVGDALNARTRMGSPGWRFRLLEPAELSPPPAEIPTSLDAFFMEAAWRVRDRLPAFPEGGYHLRDWPDLGAAAEFSEALPIVRALLRERANIADIVRSSRRSEQDVSACLWALAAADILLGRKADASVDVAPKSEPAAGSIWSRLVARLGIKRNS